MQTLAAPLAAGEAALADALAAARLPGVRAAALADGSLLSALGTGSRLPAAPAGGFVLLVELACEAAVAARSAAVLASRHGAAEVAQGSLDALAALEGAEQGPPAAWVRITARASRLAAACAPLRAGGASVVMHPGLGLLCARFSAESGDRGWRQAAALVACEAAARAGEGSATLVSAPDPERWSARRLRAAAGQPRAHAPAEGAARSEGRAQPRRSRGRPIVDEAPLGTDARQAIDLYAKSLDCVHCGLCLPTCPTYRETGRETSSPRGRIYLMRGVAEGRIPLAETVAEEMYLCLGCRACETACPSGVQFGTLLEEMRAEVERRGLRTGLAKRLETLALRGVIPHPRRLRALVEPAGPGAAHGSRAAAAARSLPARLRGAGGARAARPAAPRARAAAAARCRPKARGAAASASSWAASCRSSSGT